MPKKEELYFSIDIEADGPIPSKYSMLSIGGVALTKHGEVKGQFTRNLETLPGAIQDHDTMQFWARNEVAYNEARKNPVDPEKAMRDFVYWVDSLCGTQYTPVAVCAPVGFDFTFVYWYLINFVGESPFRFNALDMRSYYAGMFATTYTTSSKRFWPASWFPAQGEHAHVAVLDALEQGIAFIHMLDEGNDPTEIPFDAHIRGMAKV